MSESSSDGNKGVDFKKLMADFDDFRKVPLRERITNARLSVNSYLEHFPSFSISSWKNKTTTEVIEEPLHAASEYFHKEYPFAATVTKNHGYLILFGTFLVGLYPFRSMFFLMSKVLILYTCLDLSFKRSLLAHSITIGLTGASVGVANFKWNFPKKHE